MSIELTKSEVAKILNPTHDSGEVESLYKLSEALVNKVNTADAAIQAELDILSPSQIVETNVYPGVNSVTTKDATGRVLTTITLNNFAVGTVPSNANRRVSAQILDFATLTSSDAVDIESITGALTFSSAEDIANASINWGLISDSVDDATTTLASGVTHDYFGKVISSPVGSATSGYAIVYFDFDISSVSTVYLGVADAPWPATPGDVNDTITCTGTIKIYWKELV